MIPPDFDNIDFDGFFKTVALAAVAREMCVTDIETGVNKGYVEAHPDYEE